MQLLEVNSCAGFNKLKTQADELNGLQSGLICIGIFFSVATRWLPNTIFGLFLGRGNIAQRI